MAIGHVLLGVLLCLTIIGIPLGIGNFKLRGRRVGTARQGDRVDERPARRRGGGAVLTPEGSSDPCRWLASDGPPERPGAARYELLPPRPDVAYAASRLTVGPVDAVGPEPRRGARWVLDYEPVADLGPEGREPYAVYLVGVNAPVDATPDEMAEFEEFYTNVHMPEVAERRSCLGARRYRLVAELVPPAGGSPQYLTTYEVDERGSTRRRHIGGSYFRGPRVWQRHRTVWRLWYRVVPEVGAR